MITYPDYIPSIDGLMRAFRRRRWCCARRGKVRFVEVHGIVPEDQTLPKPATLSSFVYKKSSTCPYCKQELGFV